jgi:CRP-like cAMP-binding protein
MTTSFAATGSERVARAHAITSNKLASSLEQTVTLLEGFGQSVAIHRDRAIFCDGDRSDHAYRVESGVVRFCRVLSDGRRQIIAFAHPGQFFGFGVLGKQSVTAEAATDVKLTRYARIAINDLTATHPAFARSVLSITADELQRALQRLVVLGRNTALEKLATFLIEMTDLDGGPAIKHREVRLPMCRRDIADYLGLTLETVSRLFAQLKQAGLVSLPSCDRVVLVRPDAIKEMLD